MRQGACSAHNVRCGASDGPSARGHRVLRRHGWNRVRLGGRVRVRHRGGPALLCPVWTGDFRGPAGIRGLRPRGLYLAYRHRDRSDPLDAAWFLEGRPPTPGPRGGDRAARYIQPYRNTSWPSCLRGDVPGGASVRVVDRRLARGGTPDHPQRAAK